jgi:hypothetical protein
MASSPMIIAIHPDDYTAPGKPPHSDAASPRWARLLQESGHKVRWVDVRRADVLEQLNGCQGFMWRWAHFKGMSRIARRLLPVIERELKLVVYPNQDTCWHYDDKIAQAYLLNATGVPTPATWVWFDQEKASAWADSASFPLVIKLATGAGSRNVALVRTADEAKRWIKHLYLQRVTHLHAAQFEPLGWKQRLRLAASVLLTGRTPPVYRDNGYETQSGYVLFQEFLPANDYDTRVTVIGNRAFAYQRLNRKNDFRASGSGNILVDPSNIDLRFVRLAFEVARRIRSSSCAIDGLYRNGKCVVAEISYTYVSWMVHSCPGHWEIEGMPSEGTLVWRDGNMWPEEAQIRDFLTRLQLRSKAV